MTALQMVARTLTILSVSAAVARAGDGTLQVIRNGAGLPVAVEATGLPERELAAIAKASDASERLAALLQLAVIDEAVTAELPPMAGTWTAGKTSVRFTPRFPLVPGNRYRARLFSQALHTGTPAKDRPVTLEFDIAAETPTDPTEVTQIYPSSGTLPANNLRFYIHFSESMGRGEAYQFLWLLDDHGCPVDDPFLELGEELWDPRFRRLTLLIDPGRIKQGVKPREDQGPVLEAGSTYTLVVRKGWRDAQGRPLQTEFRKRFRVTDPADKALDPRDWQIAPPARGSLDPLVVRFPAPLDRALLERTMTVAVLDGPQVAGRVTLADDERRWEFRPQAPWPGGRLQLVIDPALEDLAGNRIGKPFEVDEFTQVDKTAESEPTRLLFEIAD